jgi:hypothetical protein
LKVTFFIIGAIKKHVSRIIYKETVIYRLVQACKQRQVYAVFYTLVSPEVFHILSQSTDLQVSWFLLKSYRDNTKNVEIFGVQAKCTKQKHLSGKFQHRDPPVRIK